MTHLQCLKCSLHIRITSTESVFFLPLTAWVCCSKCLKSLRSLSLPLSLFSQRSGLVWGQVSSQNLVRQKTAVWEWVRAGERSLLMGTDLEALFPENIQPKWAKTPTSRLLLKENTILRLLSRLNSCFWLNKEDFTTALRSCDRQERDTFIGWNFNLKLAIAAGLLLLAESINWAKYNWFTSPNIWVQGLYCWYKLPLIGCHWCLKHIHPSFHANSFRHWAELGYALCHETDLTSLRK